ncbi:MAG: response regulator [Cytophagaceae bacterium]
MKKIDLVLLVEDDPITNYINRRLINKAGVAADVQIALNGEDALALIEERIRNNKSCPDLIFLDINMPVMDGFEFLERFRRLDFPNKEKVVIVMLTTSTHIKDMDKLGSFGNSEIISKPLNLEKLSRVTSKYFNPDEISQSA